MENFPKINNRGVGTITRYTRVPISSFFFLNISFLLSEKVYIWIKYTLFYKQRFFSTQPQCCLRFSEIELQMLLRWCLIHIAIITLRQILYIVCLCPCLGLGLVMSYLCDLFFISCDLIFIVIYHITSLKQTYLFFLYIFRISPIIFGW